MMSSGLAAQLSQSLEIIVWALVSQWDNSSHSTAPTASTDRAIGQNATAHHHVGDPAEAVEREGRGLWSEKQRSLERSACRALLVIARRPATKVRFWPYAEERLSHRDVGFRPKPDADLRLARPQLLT
jgi:hypothetical protein